MNRLYCYVRKPITYPENLNCPENRLTMCISIVYARSLICLFRTKNNTLCVVFQGAHSIGVGHCNAFSVRLYNFSGKGDQDPSLNATYATLLKSQCKNLTDNTTFVPMEPLTPLTFNNNYYVILQQHRGLFESDAALLTNPTSAEITREMLNSDEFFEDFRESIKKMGAIGVLTGKSGEIRKVCSKVN